MTSQEGGDKPFPIRSASPSTDGASLFSLLQHKHGLLKAPVSQKLNKGSQLSYSFLFSFFFVALLHLQTWGRSSSPPGELLPPTWVRTERCSSPPPHRGCSLSASSPCGSAPLAGGHFTFALAPTEAERNQNRWFGIQDVQTRALQRSESLRQLVLGLG